MATIQKYISRLLLGIFLFAITPHELLHDLAGHYDTIDPINSVTSLSAKHIHCEILQLQLLPFANATTPFIRIPEPFAYSTPASTITFSGFTRIFTTAPRGPPSC